VRLFVSESVCSGALSGAELPPSLLAEGLAMRDAILADFASLPGVEVVTTCDRRVPLPGDAAALVVATAEEERAEFERLCRSCDATYVIAPELEKELVARCHTAARLNPRPLNCAVAAVSLCSDKLALWERLRDAGIPTIETWEIDASRTLAQVADRNAGLFPCVIKPRFGAGSQATFLCRTFEELARRSGGFDPRRPESQAIVQPYRAGRALSVAAIVNPATGEPAHLFPVAEQRLADDGTFRYLGGRIPAVGMQGATARLEELVRRTCAAVQGLRGYVGFDLLLSDDGSPRLVEINPRLTTSYVGYRRLARQNLAAFLLDPSSRRPLDWGDGMVEFRSDGAFGVV
jgi:predicted ATP-grasp superfamily ATP-dependent carboligase